MCTSAPVFFSVDVRDPNLGSHACITNILPIELSTQPILCIFDSHSEVSSHTGLGVQLRLLWCVTAVSCI